MDDVLSTEQAAVLSGCEPETIQDMARRKQLPGLKLGRAWVFPRQAFLETLNNLARDNLSRPAAPGRVGRPRNSI